jgi:O-antigen/teichoic acid export membrane protein
MVTRVIAGLSSRLKISASFTSNVATLLFANALNNGTIFLANILIARNCGPEMFGAFSVAVSVTLMALTLSEFGMNYSMIRLYAEHSSDREKSHCVLLANLYFKVAVIGVLAVASLLASGLLSRALFHDSARSGLVGIALVSGGVLGVWSFFRVYFQLLGRFRAIAGLTVVYALFRMLILGTLLLWAPGTSPESLLLGVYVLPLAAVIWFGLASFRKKVSLIPSSGVELWQTGRESMHYSKWVALTGISFTLIQQSLVFIVSSLGGIRQVALLNAGLVFTAVFSLVSDAISQVLYPKVAGYPVGQLRDYRSRLLRLFPLLLLGATVVMALLSLLMVLCLGEKYLDSLSIFWITGFGVAITAYLGLYAMALHTIKRPELAAYVNGVTLVLFTLSGVLLMKFVSLQAVALGYVVALVAGELAKAFLIDRFIVTAPATAQGDCP